MNIKKPLLLLLNSLLALAPGNLGAQTEATASAEPEEVLRAVSVVPHERQVAWQRLEFIAFIHFGVNTFTDREWGTGKEDPKIFNPSRLDCRQWAKTCRAAGMKQIILTAKHHDGFCLWPSRFTEHSVKNSPWRSGHGDVVSELAAACRDAHLKLGIYLSPADLNAIERGVYGSKKPAQKQVIPSPRPGWEPQSPERFEGVWDEYNTYFMNQLFELLTEYGEISEVWFDGANPKPGTGQTYAYQDWYALIRKLQPKAVIFGKGPDVRWIGNEAGGSRREEWSVVPIPLPPEQYTWPDMTDADLGSRARLKNAKNLVWYPAETDVSIRPGWFYHAREDGQVKSLEHLLDMYYRSVGGNSVFLLNVPPDRRGLLHENDTHRLAELGAVLGSTFTDNLTRGATAKASRERAGKPEFAAAKSVDGDRETCWTTDEGVTRAEIEYTLPRPRSFNVAMIQEQIRLGQRIESCAVDAWVAGAWKELATATTVGAKRLLRFDPVEASKVRLRITASRASPAIAEFGLFNAPLILAPPVVQRNREGLVSVTAKPGVEIHYTLDGAAPNIQSKLYERPFALPQGGVLRVLASAAKGVFFVGTNSETRCEFGLAKTKWKIVSADSEEIRAGNHAATQAIDGDPRTSWTTQTRPTSPGFPHELVIDLGETVEMAGFLYLPRQDRGVAGLVSQCEFYTSADGQSWGAPVARGDFGNLVNNPIAQKVPLAKSVSGRFVRFVALASADGKPAAGAAEIDVIPARP
jgi:alpha-L-fucosidase